MVIAVQEFQRQAELWLKEAGSLILRMSARGVSGTLKADATPVTEIDHAVEILLRERIAQAYPQHGIIGEEMPSHQPEAPWRWLIDPIDGTRALMAGFSSYTILLALAEGVEPRYGAIYQPITGEFWCGDSFTKTALRNGQPIQTRPCAALQDAFFSTTSPMLFPKGCQPQIQQVMETCKAYQLGGDGYAYAKLASGSIDVIVESGLKPYDFMALIPVIMGAGGVITDWQGKALTLDSAGDVIAAGDARVHEQMRDWLR